MNSDLLAMLSGAGLGGSTTRRDAAAANNEGKTLLRFKAGKMTATLQPNGKYLIQPDARRGLLQVLWNNSSSSSNSSSGQLKVEWTDRRTQTVVDSLRIGSEDAWTYSKVDTGRTNDRVYLLQHGAAAAAAAGTASDQRFFFWMQDREEDRPLDEEHCVKINTYMADPVEAAMAAGMILPASSSATATRPATAVPRSRSRPTVAETTPLLDLSALTTAAASGTAAGNTSSTVSLDNDMIQRLVQGLQSSQPRQGTTVDSSSSAAAAAAAAAAAVSETMTDTTTAIASSDELVHNSNAVVAETPSSSSTTVPPPVRVSTPSTSSSSSVLTLADLQGAMASLATASPPSSSSSSKTSLQELIHPDILSDSQILSNSTVKERLLALLPPGQNHTIENLMENISSPPMRACLEALSNALTGGGGTTMSWNEFSTIMMNFNLLPQDGFESFHQGGGGGPIQAFLDCVLKSVERGDEEEKANNGKSEGGDVEMKEDDDDKKDKEHEDDEEKDMYD